MAERALSGRLDRMVDTILARGDATAALADPELGAARPPGGGAAALPESRRSRRGSRPRLKERTTMSTHAATALQRRHGPARASPPSRHTSRRRDPRFTEFREAGVRGGGDRDHDGAARRAPRAADRRLDADGGREHRGGRGAGPPGRVSHLRRGRGRRRIGARSRPARRRSASPPTGPMASAPASSRTRWATTGTSAAR